MEPPESVANLLEWKGHRVPFTVAWEDGVPDFKATDPAAWSACVQQRLCGVCGEKLGYWIAFLGGEKSVENRSFYDPAMHEECARYALATCPFLVGSIDYASDDRTVNRPDREASKISSSENPEKMALYVTRDFSVRSHVSRDTRGAAHTDLYIKAAPVKRLEWHERGGTHEGPVPQESREDQG